MKKVKNKYVWSNAELENLEALFPVTTNTELIKLIGVSRRTIIRKARELNLQKHPDFRILIDFQFYGKQGAAHPNAIAARWQKGEHISPETEFKPGQEPWIKGTTFLERLQYQNAIKYCKLNN